MMDRKQPWISRDDLSGYVGLPEAMTAMLVSDLLQMGVRAERRLSPGGTSTLHFERASLDPVLAGIWEDAHE